jgi:hypothetical protein
MNDPSKPPPKEEPFTFTKCIVCKKDFSIPCSKVGDPGWMTCNDCFAPFLDRDDAWEGDDLQ